MWRGGVGAAYLLPALSYAGASIASPCFRFHIPLIEPDMQISRFSGHLEPLTSTSLFQFPIFENVLSVGHGLNANIQNAMTFKPGSIASKHQIA
jgi:hypothetical protein